VLTLVSLSSIGLPGTNGFVGEFLVLIGSFGRYPWATAAAASGVIFAAAYLLWALQRIIYNPLTSDENAKMPDLSRRELVVLAPLIAVILWVGLYPAPLLKRIESSTAALVEQVGRYAPPPGMPAVTVEGALEHAD